MPGLIMRLLSFTLLIFAAGAGAAEGEPYRRSVSFEWDPVEGAQAYELVIRSVGARNLKLQFKPRENKWSGRLPPGHYEMTTRSLDGRGVPGDWAPSTPFDVALEKPVLVAPASRAGLVLKEEKSARIDFSWNPVGGARAYEIEIRSGDGSFALQETTSDVALARELPVAKTFTWKVRALGPEDLTSEAESGFSLTGARLASPQFEQPENDFVREVRWEAPPLATAYDVEVHRYNQLKKSWESVALARNLDSSRYPIDLKWPGGVYQLNVLAKADLRQASQEAALRFRLRPGDRSPAAEETAEIRKSIDRTNGWYGIASYLVTVVAYRSSNLDTGQETATKFNAFGGTGRLGAGYFLRESSWGFLGISEISGFINDQNKSLTYLSAELNAVWRRYFNRRSEMRVQLGGFYKEQPAAIGDRRTLSVGSYTNVAAAGPRAGAEYWYSLTPKLGLQLNLHLYESLYGVSTPNGLELEPALSSQLGFLGSYRLSSRTTGLAGYAWRDDRVRYRSTSGKTNDVEISGNYVNLFLEYGF